MLLGVPPRTSWYSWCWTIRTGWCRCSRKMIRRKPTSTPRLTRYGSVDQMGDTLAHYCAYKSYKEALRFISDHGGNLTLMNSVCVWVGSGEWLLGNWRLPRSGSTSTVWSTTDRTRWMSDANPSWSTTLIWDTWRFQTCRIGEVTSLVFGAGPGFV